MRGEHAALAFGAALTVHGAVAALMILLPPPEAQVAPEESFEIVAIEEQAAPPAPPPVVPKESPPAPRPVTPAPPSAPSQPVIAPEPEVLTSPAPPEAPAAFAMPQTPQPVDVPAPPAPAPPVQPVQAQAPPQPAVEEYVPVDIDAAYRSNPPPPYPMMAKRRGLQGKVVLAVALDVNGRPTRVAVKQSSGHGVLDEAAEQAVRGWRFRPAQRNGRAVAADVEVPIRFNLK